MKFINQGNIVLDIGGNIGFHALYFSRLVGEKGKVYSFEPEKTNFEHLKHLTKKNKNVVLRPFAVGDKNKKIPFFISNVLNVQHQTYPSLDTVNKYLVRQVTLDKFFSNKKVDFVKIDIQGGEYLALKGMSKTIQKNPEITIMMEMEPRILDDRRLTPGKVFTFIRKLGLNIYVVQKGKLVSVNNSIINNYDTFKKFQSDTWLISRHKNLKFF